MVIDIYLFDFFECTNVDTIYAGMMYIYMHVFIMKHVIFNDYS